MTKQDGLRLREQRRERVRRIRARVVGGSIALFLAVWILITVVLVTGHDPALARKTLTSAATPATTTSATTTSATSGFGGTSSSTGSTSSGATSTSTGSSPSGASSVTSSQS